MIDNTEMARRSREIDTRSRRFDQERQALIARKAELATGDRLQHCIANFAQRAMVGIGTLDFAGRQELLRLVLEDVRVRGWHVELRLRIPLDDDNPPAGVTTSTSVAGRRARPRSRKGVPPAKEAVSRNNGLRSIGEDLWARLAKAGASAAVVFVGLTAVPLAYQFFGPGRIIGPIEPLNYYVTDIVNVVVPNAYTALDPHALSLSERWSKYTIEDDAYIGLPPIVIGVFTMTCWWRERWVRLVGLGTVAAFVWSLSAVHLASRRRLREGDRAPRSCPSSLTGSGQHCARSL